MFEQKIFGQTVPVFEGWVKQVRQSMTQFLAGKKPSAEWVADTLGLVDTALARVLADAAFQKLDERTAAEHVWHKTFGNSVD